MCSTVDARGANDALSPQKPPRGSYLRQRGTTVRAAEGEAARYKRFYREGDRLERGIGSCIERATERWMGQRDVYRG